MRAKKNGRNVAGAVIADHSAKCTHQLCGQQGISISTYYNLIHICVFLVTTSVSTSDVQGWSFTPLPYRFISNHPPQENDAKSAGLSPERTFRVDHVNNMFRKDGQPFRFVGGSFHYFRALPGTWQHKLRTMRAAGLNVVTTYVEWSLHNPHDGVYAWDDITDVVRFIELAALEDLLVVLRPGPYICAERDLVSSMQTI